MMVCYEHLPLVEIIPIWINANTLECWSRNTKVTLSRGKKSMASNTCGNIITWVSFNILGALNAFN
jgi:hypothetical protein